MIKISWRRNFFSDQKELKLLQLLMEDEAEKYQTHFSDYVNKGLEPDNMEEMYKKVHAAIRADPLMKKSEKEAPKEHKR